MVRAHRSAPDTSDPAHPGVWARTGWPVSRRDRWQRLFRGQEGELCQLRRWLTGLLPDTSARDDLISVAVELGTNAIQHTASGTGGWFTVEVACLGPVIRVAVTDEGAPGAPCVNEDPLSDRGRGLVIVRALSVSSGVCGNTRGRTVWAEIAITPDDPQGRSNRPSASSAMAISRTL
jgi:hypothetical protein